MASKKGMKPLKIGIVINRQKPGAASLARELQRYEANNSSIEFYWDKEAAGLLGKKGVALNRLIERVDLFLVAGGDGSLLEVARRLYPAQIPILGINIGSLGFLTSLAQTELIPSLPELAKRKWKLSPRLALETVIHRGRRSSLIPASLNDVVISRVQSRLVRIRVKVGNAFVTEYVCDGLVVSTPTGSTAYSVSAGGPMVSPDAEAIVLTPICAHTLTNRSLVVSSHQPILVEIPPQQRLGLSVHFDGKSEGTLHQGDWLEIRRAKADVILAYTAGRDFYTILREKLRWSGANI